MKKTIALALVAVIVIAALVAGSAIAGAANVNVSATSNTRLILELDSNSVSFPNVDLDAGSEIAGAVTGRVKSNVFYDLEVAANADLTGATTGATIPAGNLQWSDQSSPGYNAFSTSSDLIYDNNPRGVDPFAFDYKITIGYDYPPDTYNTTLTYTLTQSL